MTDEPTAAVDRARSAVRGYLIYVVLDTSESMRRPPRSAPRASSPLAHFERHIPRMLRQLADHPVTNSLASVSVVAFNDEPEVLREMSPLHRPTPIRRPRLGYGTDYASVLRFLVRQHARDVRTVRLTTQRDDYSVELAPPWIFFITDGRPFAHDANQPTSAWLGPRDQLVDPPVGARIVALGLPGADQAVLWRLATGQHTGARNAFIAERSADPGGLAASAVAAIQTSVAASVSTGQLVIRTPDGMRRIDERHDA